MSYLNIVIILIIIDIIGMFLLVKLQIFSKLNVQFIRFLGTGVLNTLNYYFFFTILNLFLNYVVAHVIAFIISALISYFVSSYYTFQKKPSKKSFVKFPTSILPNFLVSTILTPILVNYFNTSEDYTSFILQVLAIPVTFIITRIIFNKEKHLKETN